jgi:hypothetical protein
MNPPKPGFRDTIATKRTGGYDKDGRALWRLTEPLLYFSPSLNLWLMVLEEFITNYASVPRLPFIYAMYGDIVYEEPGFHDQGYTIHGLIVVTLDEDGNIIGEPELRPATREQIDDLFLEAILLNPAIEPEKAHAMHLGVRIGGDSSWRDETNVLQPPHIMAMILPLEPLDAPEPALQLEAP